MGALQIEKLKSWHDCSLGCVGAHGARMTRKRVTIIGRPLPAVGRRKPGFACDDCCRELQEAWDGALKRIKAEDAEEQIAA